MSGRFVVVALLWFSIVAAAASAQDLPLRDPFGGDLTEGLDELLQQPESEDTESAALPAEIAGPVDQLLELMGQAAEQLSAGVTGPPTQQVQQSIVNQLDGWLGRNSSAGQSGGSQAPSAAQQQAEQSQPSAESAPAEGEQAPPTAEQQESAEPGSEGGENGGAGPSGDRSAAASSESSAADPLEGNQGEGRPDASSGASAKPGRAADVDPNLSGGTAQGGDVWGHLPPRVRDRVRSVSPEDYLPQYRKAIEEYFKRIAEQGR